MGLFELRFFDHLVMSIIMDEERKVSLKKHKHNKHQNVGNYYQNHACILLHFKSFRFLCFCWFN